MDTAQARKMNDSALLDLAATCRAYLANAPGADYKGGYADSVRSTLDAVESEIRRRDI